MNINHEQKIRLGLALGAVVALVAGYAVIGESKSNLDASAASFRQGGPGKHWQGPHGASGATGGAGQPGQPGQNGQRGEHGPGGQGGPPRMNELSGTTREKAVAAAKKAYDGTVDHAFAKPNGSGYVVVFEKSDGTHVAVELSKKFKVTGKHTMQGPPGGGRGGPPAGEQPPQGTTTQ